METSEKNPIKILIVDDSTTSLLLNEICARKFFPKDILLLAVNGEAGLDIFKENLDIKIVISDYEMPKMDGIEMIHEIKLLNPEVRALCITSKNMETLKHEFDVCMVKPITKEEFRVKMFDLLMKKYRTK